MDFRVIWHKKLPYRTQQRFLTSPGHCYSGNTTFSPSV